MRDAPVRRADPCAAGAAAASPLCQDLELDWVELRSRAAVGSCGGSGRGAALVSSRWLRPRSDQGVDTPAGGQTSRTCATIAHQAAPLQGQRIQDGEQRRCDTASADPAPHRGDRRRGPSRHRACEPQTDAIPALRSPRLPAAAAIPAAARAGKIPARNTDCAPRPGSGSSGVA
jgi:hypothetical protein